MSHKELHRRWRRRLTTLEDGIHTLFEECRVTGGARTLHALRVALRRGRLYAHVGRPLLRKGSLTRFEDWARTTNDLLGPVRDCDVCMNWLAARPGSLDAIQSVHEERTRLWGLAGRVLARRKSDLRGGMVFRKEGKDGSQKLWSRYGRELKRLTQEAAAEAVRARQMNPEELHRVRRRLRRWRYLRELSLPGRVHRSDATLSWLVRVQDALGESQNLQMALALFRNHPEWPESGRCIDRARVEQARWIARATKDLLKIPREKE